MPDELPTHSLLRAAFLPRTCTTQTPVIVHAGALYHTGCVCPGSQGRTTGSQQAAEYGIYACCVQARHACMPPPGTSCMDSGDSRYLATRTCVGRTAWALSVSMACSWWPRALYATKPRTREHQACHPQSLIQVTSTVTYCLGHSPTTTCSAVQSYTNPIPVSPPCPLRFKASCNQVSQAHLAAQRPWRKAAIPHAEGAAYFAA